MNWLTWSNSRCSPSPAGCRAAHHRVDVPRPGALPRHARAAARHPLASGERAAADGIRPRPDGRARPHPAGRQTLLHEHRIRLGAKGIRAVHAARHLRRRARATRSTRPICSACWSDATSSPAPVPPRGPAAAAAVRPRCTASPSRGIASPTSSRHCARPGESTRILHSSLKRQCPDGLGQRSRSRHGAEWIGQPPHEELQRKRRPLLPADDSVLHPAARLRAFPPGHGAARRDVELAFLGLIPQQFTATQLLYRTTDLNGLPQATSPPSWCRPSATSERSLADPVLPVRDRRGDGPLLPVVRAAPRAPRRSVRWRSSSSS